MMIILFIKLQLIHLRRKRTLIPLLSPSPHPKEKFVADCEKFLLLFLYLATELTIWSGFCFLGGIHGFLLSSSTLGKNPLDCSGGREVWWR